MSPKILIVDDEEAVLYTVELYLKGTEYNVIACSSAEAAISEFENRKMIDVLFTDVILGEGKNGYQLAHTVSARWPETKILITSGFTESALSDRGLPVADFPFLQKPYRREALLEIIRN